MKLRNWSYIFMMAIALLAFSSCDKQEDFDTDKLINEEEEIIDYLLERNYVLDSIEFKSDMVFVNSHSGYIRKNLLDVIHGKVSEQIADDPDAADFSSADMRQRAVSESNRQNAVTQQNIVDVKYFMRASVQNDCGNGWFNALNEAATDWNNVSNCRLVFRRVFQQSQADIIVAADTDNILPSGLQNLPSGVLSGSTISLNGNAGSFISITASRDWWPSKKRTTLGSLGRCIGFENTDGTAGQHVHGTPVSQNNSVMNAAWADASTTFQSGDLRMARIFYPNSLERPIQFQAFENGQGNLQVNYYNPNHIVKPYYWVRVAKYRTSGQIVSVRYMRSTTTHPIYGFDTVYWSGHSGTWLFALRGCNFRRDVWSSRTNQIQVSF